MRSDVEFKGLKQGFAEWLKAWNSKVNTLEWREWRGLWKDMQLQLIYDLGHHGSGMASLIASKAKINFYHYFLCQYVPKSQHGEKKSLYFLPLKTHLLHHLFHF